MPICPNCSNYFSTTIKIDGKTRRLGNRKYCLRCSPFGEHNTKPIHLIEKLEENTRKCSKCQEVKSIENFYTSKNKTHSWCKPCNNKDSWERQKNIKAECVEYKGGKCLHCGIKDDPCIYDFHHIDATTKNYTIARFTHRSLQSVKSELDKCILLCSNCHRKEHSKMI